MNAGDLCELLADVVAAHRRRTRPQVMHEATGRVLADGVYRYHRVMLWQPYLSAPVKIYVYTWHVSAGFTGRPFDPEQELVLRPLGYRQPDTDEYRGSTAARLCLDAGGFDLRYEHDELPCFTLDLDRYDRLRGQAHAESRDVT